MSKEIYLLVDDYTPDAGSTIYGAFSTRELAEERLAKLSSYDNEYGHDVNEDGTIEIKCISVDYGVNP